MERVTILAKKLFNVIRCVVFGETTYYPDFVTRFEEDFARYIGVKHGISFCNGTSTIEAALFAVGVSTGDEVIVPSLTFHASVSPIVNSGGRVVFCEVDSDTLTLDTQDLKRKITDKTKCIIVVHVWGYPADMTPILEIAEQHGIPVIEDASHAHGASIGSKKVGSIGSVGCFSLQGNKPVSAGEGGIATTDSDELATRLMLFGHFGRGADQLAGSIYEEMRETGLGYKRRVNPLGICLAQVDLDYLEIRNERKSEYARQLDKVISRIPYLHAIAIQDDHIRGGFYWGYPVLIRTEAVAECDPEAVVESLRSSGIQAERYPYCCNHTQRQYFDPVFRQRIISQNEEEDSRAQAPSLPITESVVARLFFLPLPNRPKHKDLITIKKVLHQCFDGKQN